MNRVMVRVVPISGEVVAEYKVEETTMRLSIVMPVDWPLSVPLIQIDKAIVPSEKVKKWLLQLTAYLFHQNGSTMEGILMWRKNVDRDVEGAEACTICMMTIHSTNHQLPKNVTLQIGLDEDLRRLLLFHINHGSKAPQNETDIYEVQKEVITAERTAQKQMSTSEK
ncbi:hypothetical protein Y032_0891g2893 [Ancylostoma ceylanicum]|uniref:E3 ubiquitin-protein ligase listerin n=1 Tax=Ancylostoma ceylanicum TaxID=53326 RepID=A0A016WBW1_9BILA|nr:hypothetical protein Y032_0891g2893 [Ancylostoma ceylanicum]